MAATVQTTEDDHVGKVAGNILDQYDSPTYNFRLFMFREAESISAPSSFAAIAADSDLTADNAVILAQTGVTGTIIDNVEIESLMSGAGTVPTKVRFTITQPGAASFLDQIQLAKAHLGHPPKVAMPTVFLDLTFQGYEEFSSSSDDIDSGGAVATIAGPYRFKLLLSKLSVSISGEGSSYEVECLSMATSAYRDMAYKMPSIITTSGVNIEEHVKSLESALNDAADVGAGIPNKYKFDLSQLIGTDSGQAGDDRILDTSLSDPSSDGNIERTTSVPLNDNDNSTKSTSETSQRAQDSAGITGAASEATAPGVTLTFEKGTTIESFFQTILSMNDEMTDKISRRRKLDDPESEVNKQQAHVSWIKVNADVTQQLFDESRNTYSELYTYQPVLYKDIRDDIVLASGEKDITADDGAARIEQISAYGGLKKSYGYFFTGRNDQVLELDIKYDNGTVLLLEPLGGTLGAASSSNPAKSSQTIAPLKDVTPEALNTEYRELSKNLTTAKTIDSLFGALVGNDSAGRDDVFDLIAGQVGLSVSTIADTILNQRALDQSALSSLIANQPFGETFLKEEEPSISEPKSTTTNSDGSAYKPVLSGLVYGADLVNPNEPIIDAATLAETGQVDATSVSDAMQCHNPTEFASRPSTTKTAAFSQFTPRNTLFGAIAGTHADLSFLLSLEMKLRGDPWYLGSPGTVNSTDTQANFDKDDNAIWLKLQAPITYDPDTEDEDNNTGYWKYDGVSRTFSGLYKLLKCINTFAGGVYTTDVLCVRVVSYDNVPKKEVTAEPTEEETTAGDFIGPQQPLSEDVDTESDGGREN